MALKNLPVAVLGCGHWGKNLVRKFHELGVLTAISDPNGEVCRQLGDAYGVEARSIDDILADDAIEAVAIASPADLHHELVIRSFAAGKHVFVEKPIALSLEDAAEMIAAGKQAQKILMVGHLLQYHPAFLKLKSLVLDGELGNLRYIYSRRLSLGKLRTEENVLWSFAPHDISMILALAGQEPDKVQGSAGNFLQDHISDFASIHMGFPNGIKAHVNVSWLNPFKEQRLVVVGDKAMAEFDDCAPWSEKLKLYRHRAEIVDGVPLVEKAEAELVEIEEFEPLLNECRYFLEFAANNQTPFSDGAEAIAVLKVLQAGDATSQGE